MFFIEHFLDMANKDGYVDYVRMMQRDIIRVVDAVAPDDGSGAANVKIVRKVGLPFHLVTTVSKSNHCSLPSGPQRSPGQVLP